MIRSIFYFAVCLACQTRQEKLSPTAQIQSVGHLSPALRIEAGRLASAPASQLFAALAERKDDASAFGLSKDQLQLILEMDATARKTLQRWLVRPRDIDKPSLNVEDYAQARAFVIGHMEAILFECVLTPAQAAEWRKLANKPVTPPRSGRYPRIPRALPPREPPPEETQIGFFRAIRGEALNPELAGRRGAWSELFRIILVPEQDPIPRLTADQTDLLQRIDGVARDAQKLWLWRAINNGTPIPENQRQLPPTPVMVSRLSETGRLLRASVVSHAEEIALEAVIDHEQQREVKRRFWISRGVFALLDPELAGILHVSKSEHQSICLLIEQRAFLQRRADIDEMAAYLDRSDALSQGRISRQEGARLEQQAIAAKATRLSNFDAAIWDVLSTAQSRTLAKILRKPTPKKEDEKTKKKSSRAS